MRGRRRSEDGEDPWAVVRETETGRAPTPAFFTVAVLAGAPGLSMGEPLGRCAPEPAAVPLIAWALRADEAFRPAVRRLMSVTLQDFDRSEYVSLTTYRENGTPVATPVWAAVEGDVLYVWTRSDSWKVKRLRNNSRVAVTVCDVRGRIAEGAPSAEGAGLLLDADGTRKVRGLLARKYTWKFWLVDRPAAIVRLGKRPHTGIAVTF